MTSPSLAQLDLLALHGTSTLEVGMPFSSGSTATAFMQDCTYNRNSHCVVTSSGKLKKYRCDQHEKGCKWEVRVTVRIKSDKSRHLFVSAINDKHHDSCMSVAKPTTRQLTLLPTLRSAVIANRNVKRKALTALVQARDGVSLQRNRSKLYRAKEHVINSVDGEWTASFRRLPFMLADLRVSNPGSTVHLEVDQHQRFLRGFVAFGANISGQKHILPLLGFDGAHSKHSKFNGVILSLLGRDGNYHNVTLATALVNVENEGNILWFLRRSFEAGIVLSDRALFCDHGKIIGAVKHFRDHTGLRGQAFENAVWAVQAADSHEEYSKALDNILSNYGAVVTECIKDIGPGVWTVHANMEVYVPPENSLACGQFSVVNDRDNDESVYTTCNDVPYSNEHASNDEDCDCVYPEASNPLPLFNWRTSNFVESENNAMLASGVRESDPFNAFYKLAVSEMAKFTKRHEEILKWKTEERVLTPYAKKLWQVEKQRSGEYFVVRSSDSVLYVSHPAKPTKNRQVNLESLTCTCATFDQVRVACRHLFVTLRDRGQEERCFESFHPAYLVSNYEKAYFEKGIALPVRDTPPSLVEVKPSPYYKQAGRRVKRRIASTGESRGKNTYVCRVCSDSGHNKRTCRRHGNDSDEVNADLIASVFELPQILPTGTELERTVDPVNHTTQDETTCASRMSMAFLLDE